MAALAGSAKAKRSKVTEFIARQKAGKSSLL